MNFNDGYFLNNFHKARFKDMARRNGRVYQAPGYLVSAYIFSSTPDLMAKTEPCMNDSAIDFAKILNGELGDEEKILVQFAANFYDPSRYESPSVSALINELSGESYTVMLNIFKMFN